MLDNDYYLKGINDMTDLDLNNYRCDFNVNSLSYMIRHIISDYSLEHQQRLQSLSLAIQEDVNIVADTYNCFEITFIIKNNSIFIIHFNYCCWN